MNNNCQSGQNAGSIIASSTEGGIKREHYEISTCESKDEISTCESELSRKKRKVTNSIDADQVDEQLLNDWDVFCNTSADQVTILFGLISKDFSQMSMCCLISQLEKKSSLDTNPKT